MTFLGYSLSVVQLTWLEIPRFGNKRAIVALKLFVIFCSKKIIQKVTGAISVFPELNLTLMNLARSDLCKKCGS